MAAEQPDYLLQETHDVALGNPDEDDHNTIVLSGIDIVIPVELDMDDDPFQDDSVRLRAEHGHYDQVLVASDPDVEVDAEARWLYYRFRLVPPGVYRASVRIGTDWMPLLRGLVVTKEGAFVNGEPLGEDPPTESPAEVEPDAGEGDMPATSESDCGR
jgi:hypothetical protein